MWRKEQQTLTAPPQPPVARGEVPTDADRDSKPEPPGTPEAAGRRPQRCASPCASTTPPALLVIDQVQDRVRTGWRMLLVDDRAGRRALIRTLLDTPKHTGTVVVEAASATAALAAVRGGTVDAAVVAVSATDISPGWDCAL